MKNRPHYAFLEPTLRCFFEEKAALADAEYLQRVGSQRVDLEDQCQQLVTVGVLTQEDVDHWVAPIQDLPLEKLLAIAALQTRACSGQAEGPLTFSVKCEPPKALLALSWTAFQISLLGLTGLDVVPIYNEATQQTVFHYLYPYAIPYRQCYWCGALANNHNTFIKKRDKYCHAVDCLNKTDSNPDEHMDCCSRPWSLIRRGLKENFRYQKAKETKHYKQAVTRQFKTFLEGRYQENLHRTQPIVDERSYKLELFSQNLYDFTNSLANTVGNTASFLAKPIGDYIRQSNP